MEENTILSGVIETHLKKKYTVCIALHTKEVNMLYCIYIVRSKNHFLLQNDSLFGYYYYKIDELERNFYITKGNK